MRRTPSMKTDTHTVGLCKCILSALGVKEVCVITRSRVHIFTLDLGYTGDFYPYFCETFKCADCFSVFRPSIDRFEKPTSVHLFGKMDVNR